MAFSSQRALSDGTLSDIELTIEYIDRVDLKLFVDSVQIEDTIYSYEFITDNLIRITPDVAAGEEVLIQRQTRLESVLNVYADGAVFNNASMDENFRQMLLIAQEAREGATLEEIFNDLNMHGYSIRNLANGVEPQDAVNKQQLDGVVAAATAAGAVQAGIAAGHAGAASTSATLAQRWANEDEDVPVSGSLFSARHWAAKSSDSADESAGWATTPVDVQVEPGLYSALHWATKAAESASAIVTHGGCRLTLEGSNLALRPFDGNTVRDGAGNGKIVPSVLTLAATGLTPNTTYYVYAFGAGSALTGLEASTTGYETSAGVDHKVGDTSRILVGMARPITGPAWVDSTVRRFVRSRFNSPSVCLTGVAVAASTTTAASSLTELSTAYRVEFLVWSYECLTLTSTGWAYSSAAAEVRSAIGVDGSATRSYTSTAYGTTGGPVSCVGNFNLSEGYHFGTLLGGVSGGTGTWTGAATGRDGCAITGRIG